MPIDSFSSKSNEASDNSFQDHLLTASDRYADLVSEVGPNLADQLFKQNGLEVPGYEATEADRPRSRKEKSAQKIRKANIRRVEERGGDSIDWSTYTPQEAEIKRLQIELNDLIRSEADLQKSVKLMKMEGSLVSQEINGRTIRQYQAGPVALQELAEFIGVPLRSLEAKPGVFKGFYTSKEPAKLLRRFIDTAKRKGYGQ